MLTLALRPPRQTSHIDSVRSLREEEATEKWGGDEKPRKREENLIDRETERRSVQHAGRSKVLVKEWA